MSGKTDALIEGMTDEELAEIRARADAATPGPWQYDGQHDEITAPQHGAAGHYWIIFSQCRTAPDTAPADAFGHRFSGDFAFIAHARADVPALLDEIERLRALVERKDLQLTYGAAFIDYFLPEEGS